MPFSSLRSWTLLIVKQRGFEMKTVTYVIVFNTRIVVKTSCNLDTVDETILVSTGLLLTLKCNLYQLFIWHNHFAFAFIELNYILLLRYCSNFPHSFNKLRPDQRCNSVAHQISWNQVLIVTWGTFARD